MSQLLTSKDFDDGQEIRSEKALRRWRSAYNGLKNRRRSFHKLTDLDEHPKLQEQIRVSYVVLKAVLRFTENLSLHSNEDVPSSEYIVTDAGTEARRFQEPVDDVGSTISGLDVMIIDTETFVPHINFQISRNAPFMFVIGSYTKVCKLFGKHVKRAVAVFFLVLEVASFLLDLLPDVFGNSKTSILLAAFLLAAFGSAITMSTHICIVRRTRAAAGMLVHERLRRALEISFSLVQFIVTLIYFILAELGVKHNFNASVFPLVFAIIAAVFTFKYDGEVSDSSGLASSLMASAADLQLQNIQVHVPNIARTENEEANGSMPMLTIVTSDD